MDEPVIYLNGQFVPESKASMSVVDHAVLFELDAHIDRGCTVSAGCLVQDVH